MELTPATSAPASSHAFRPKAVHSEIGAKLLTDLGANFHVFSEQALILQGNYRILIPPCGGSNPPTPATQSSLRVAISGCARTADIPGGSGVRPTLWPAIAWSSALDRSRFRRGSLLATFLFPFGVPETGPISVTSQSSAWHRRTRQPAGLAPAQSASAGERHRQWRLARSVRLAGFGVSGID
jgi:hypothetical protein